MGSCHSSDFAGRSNLQKLSARKLFYLTHPQAQIDPEIPVPKWVLSDLGRKRTIRFSAAPFLKTVGKIISSYENKAKETGEIVADHLGLDFDICAAMHENDRSSTGYLQSDILIRWLIYFLQTPMKA